MNQPPNDRQQQTAHNDTESLALAVERVRAEAMAMRQSKDLLKVIAVLYEEMKRLGSDTYAANIFFVDTDGGYYTPYVAFRNPRKDGIDWNNPDIVKMSADTIAFIDDRMELEQLEQSEHYNWIDCWRRSEVHTYEEEIKDARIKKLSEKLGLERPLPLASNTGKLFFFNVPFQYGVIGFHEFSEAPDLIAAVEELAKALDLGYMRFLDFQRLEAQNRELEIDRALERVRAEIAAMRRTDDSEKAVRVLGEELQKVSIDIDMLGVIIFEGDRAQRGGWTLTPGLEEYVITTGQFTDDLALESIAGQLKEHWRRGEIWQRRHDPDWVRGVVTEANNKHGLSLDPEAEVWVADVPFTQGTLAVNRGWYRAEGKPFTDDEQAILKRFAEVVALGYARFADFLQLETQNRALAREAAVERIRAEAGAMLQSDDLHTVVSG